MTFEPIRPTAEFPHCRSAKSGSEASEVACFGARPPSDQGDILTRAYTCAAQLLETSLSSPRSTRMNQCVPVTWMSAIDTAYVHVI